MGLDETAFRSRDYVIAVDELSNEKAGFGRIRIHRVSADRDESDEPTEYCELTSIGVLEGWRGQGVGAHVIERLIEYASDEGFDTVYTLTGEGSYLAQFGFRRIDESNLPTHCKHASRASERASTPMRFHTHSRSTDSGCQPPSAKRSNAHPRETTRCQPTMPRRISASIPTRRPTSTTPADSLYLALAVSGQHLESPSLRCILFNPGPRTK